MLLAGQLSGLPRPLVVTAENDVLRDEAVAHGRKWIEGESEM
jgi:hypothetical protein